MKQQIILLIVALVAITYADEIECPAQENMPTYFPHPTECRYFYECSGGVPVLMDCGEYLAFNPMLNVCDLPYNVPGCFVD